mmetsp:Transcript_36079/g.85433  ORF Transcript_36079/g.85433 Transcript_36079/m.85433 type:complete len:123 (-) Transcript_36079:397-765(-)
MGSCSGCSIDDQEGMLVCAKCAQAGQGSTKVRSTIRIEDCPHMAFSNRGGQLVCEDVPPGEYLKSCKNCRKEDGHLHCDCRNSAGYTKATSVQMREDCTQYSNSEGELTCEGDAPVAPKAEL